MYNLQTGGMRPTETLSRFEIQSIFFGNENLAEISTSTVCVMYVVFFPLNLELYLIFLLKVQKLKNNSLRCHQVIKMRISEVYIVRKTTQNEIKIRQINFRKTNEQFLINKRRPPY